MTAVLQQIKKSYEELGMSPQEISQDQNLDIAAVKSALMQSSSQYRKDCGQEGEDSESGLNFTDDEMARVTRGIFEIAVDPEIEPHVRLKACMYVRDDKKGRLEKPKQLAGNTFNILQINEALAQAREGAARIKNQLLASSSSSITV